MASSSITLRKKVLLAVTCVQMMKAMTAAPVKRGHAAGQEGGSVMHAAGGLQAQERGAVQQADQDQGDAGEHAVGR